MKKAISKIIILMIIISLSYINVFAIKSVPAETYDRNSSNYVGLSVKWQQITEGSYINQERDYDDSFAMLGDFFKEKYIFYKNSSPYFKPIKYNEELENRFPNEEYIITDDGYYTRDLLLDSYVVQMKSIRNITVNDICLYDKDFNLVKKHNFGGYVYEISYIDGLYYSRYSKLNESDIYSAVSTDFDEWTEIGIDDIPKSNSENIIIDDKVRFKGNNDFNEVVYENELSAKYQTTIGEWFVKNNRNKLYLTKDNVYFIKIEENVTAPNTLNIFCVDEEGDNIIICSTNYTLYIPKNELYNAMSEYENAPYVQLNDKILGFSQPPVMEDDRTLVPMRFLFEQMGAEVDWNNDTQTATATVLADSAASTFGLENEKSVTFSIDNTTATVNGEAETMDVPARLINDQTFVPLRFLSENLGYNVEWDNDTRTAIITTE